MKTCTVCKEPKSNGHFGKCNQDRNRCTECHLVIVKNNKSELDRNKTARIIAYTTGEMPRSNKPDVFYAGKMIEIENKRLNRELERELKEYDL